MLVILGFLAGTVLAFRFTVFILVPAILVGCFLGLATGVVSGSGAGPTALTMAATAIALQLGCRTAIFAARQNAAHRNQLPRVEVGR